MYRLLLISDLRVRASAVNDVDDGLMRRAFIYNYRSLAWTWAHLPGGASAFVSFHALTFFNSPHPLYARPCLHWLGSRGEPVVTVVIFLNHNQGPSGMMPDSSWNGLMTHPAHIHWNTWCSPGILAWACQPTNVEILVAPPLLSTLHL